MPNDPLEKKTAMEKYDLGIQLQTKGLMKGSDR